MHGSHDLLHSSLPSLLSLDCLVTKAFNESFIVLLTNNCGQESFLARALTVMSLVNDQTSYDKWTNFFAEQVEH